MAEDKPPPEFMNALGTEYFVLQSTASSTISESGSRVSIYLSSLASGLVALGFTSSLPRAFASLAFTVLPTVFVLGRFTIVRLVDTSVANIISLRRMELIKRYYAALAPLAPPYFGTDDLPTGHRGVRYGRWSFLFTMAGTPPLPENLPRWKLLSLNAKLEATWGGGAGVRPEAAVQRHNPIRDRALECG
jgi:hypothetical protein